MYRQTVEDDEWLLLDNTYLNSLSKWKKTVTVEAFDQNTGTAVLCELTSRFVLKIERFFYQSNVLSSKNRWSLVSPLSRKTVIILNLVDTLLYKDGIDKHRYAPLLIT